MTTIQELTTEVRHFVADMGWFDKDSPYTQSPRSIAISLAIEAAETLECSQWSDIAHQHRLSDELADVAIYLIALADLININLERAITDRLARNCTRKRSQP